MRSSLRNVPQEWRSRLLSTYLLIKTGNLWSGLWYSVCRPWFSAGPLEIKGRLLTSRIAICSEICWTAVVLGHRFGLWQRCMVTPLYHNTDRSQPISHYREATEICPTDFDVTAQEFPVSACYITPHFSGEFQPFQIACSEGYHYEYSCGQCGEMNGGECRQVQWCRSANDGCRQEHAC
jgi:hypothetical protein